MDTFRTVVPIDSCSRKITHHTGVMLIGSCFTENIGTFLSRYKFDVDVNPFGILYNPLSIRNTLGHLLARKTFVAEEVHSFQGRWISFAHHGRFSHVDREQCLERINSAVRSSARTLREARFLFITLGTAWVFEHKETGNVVANCHRIPADMFRRRLLSVGEIVSKLGGLLSEIEEVNPALLVCFTISPIRHWKDGPHENQVSKATLQLAVHELMKQRHPTKAGTEDNDAGAASMNAGAEDNDAGAAPTKTGADSTGACVDEAEAGYPLCGYFPAYEIMMDELRDYRFYGDDMIHPGKTAMEYIWSRFGDTYFDEETKQVIGEIEAIRRACEHTPIDVRSEGHREFLKRSLLKTEALKDKYPHLDFEEEIRFFSGP